jgi:L-rhamnose isomerase/sugar isomerase
VRRTILGAPAQKAYDVLSESLANRGVEVGNVEERLRSQRVETPSWGYGNSGTRFKVFLQPGVPRDPFEMISDDAANVHRLTGICPTVAMHIPWNRVDNYARSPSG